MTQLVLCLLCEQEELTSVPGIHGHDVLWYGRHVNPRGLLASQSSFSGDNLKCDRFCLNKRWHLMKYT